MTLFTWTSLGTFSGHMTLFVAIVTDNIRALMISIALITTVVAAILGIFSYFWLQRNRLVSMALFTFFLFVISAFCILDRAPICDRMMQG